MWSDKESSIDFLNFNETAESVKDLITEKELMPISVGIFGNWGAGKSTILELTKKSLENDKEAGKEYIQIHFDAWTFEGFDDAKAALLETIASELLKEAAKAKDNEGLLKKASEFAERVDKVRLLGMLADGGATLSGFPTFGLGQKILGFFGDDSEDENEEGFEVKDFKDAADKTAKLAKSGNGVVKAKKKISPPTEIRKFRSAYASLLKDFDKPLIVYVDNLDRCTPINAISTLEAIRLFLFLPNTAFVIAADEDMIRLAVPHYHKGATQRHQSDYLDKLIQIPIHVPKPGIAEVRAYLMMLIVSDKKLEHEDFELIRSRLEESLKLSWKQEQISVDDLLEHVMFEGVDDLRGDLIVAEQLAPILTESVNINGNPRIVKRLLNQIRMRLKTSKRRGMQLDEKTITKLVIFERCMGTDSTNILYEHIDKDNGKPTVIKYLEGVEGEIDTKSIPKEWESNTAFLLKWSRLEPSFSDQDLTAAAYLSRQSIPMGSVNSVMSGAAQKLLEGLLKQKNRPSNTNDNLIEVTPTEEYVSVMDNMIIQFKSIEDWGELPIGFYGARLLAKADDKCKSIFLSYLKTLPNQRWKKVFVKELEGTK